MITLLLGAGGFVVLFFRNKLRREMNKELKMQVSTAVEHYFTLSEAQH
jgi:galactokinase/mevalonate kinase-like predicted kinase